MGKKTSCVKNSKHSSTRLRSNTNNIPDTGSWLVGTKDIGQNETQAPPRLCQLLLGGHEGQTHKKDQICVGYEMCAMNMKQEDTLYDDLQQWETEMPGLFVTIGAVPPGTIMTLKALEKIFGRCGTSVKRAVERGELPPPTKLFGNKIWTARAIMQHIEERLAEEAKKEVQKKAEEKEILKKHMP